jgi:hypothetical protein
MPSQVAQGTSKPAACITSPTINPTATSLLCHLRLHYYLSLMYGL